MSNSFPRRYHTAEQGPPGASSRENLDSPLRTKPKPLNSEALPSAVSDEFDGHQQRADKGRSARAGPARPFLSFWFFFLPATGKEPEEHKGHTGRRIQTPPPSSSCHLVMALFGVDGCFGERPFCAFRHHATPAFHGRQAFHSRIY